MSSPGRNEPPLKRHGPVGWLFARTRRFWIVTALLLPTTYVASFGPVCWWINPPYWDSVSRLYWPIGWMHENAPEPVRAAINRYATLGIPAKLMWASSFPHGLTMFSRPVSDSERRTRRRESKAQEAEARRYIEHERADSGLERFEEQVRD